jgi:hypothetical protein
MTVTKVTSVSCLVQGQVRVFAAPTVSMHAPNSGSSQGTLLPQHPCIAICVLVDAGSVLSARMCAGFLEISSAAGIEAAMVISAVLLCSSTSGLGGQPWYANISRSSKLLVPLLYICYSRAAAGFMLRVDFAGVGRITPCDCACAASLMPLYHCSAAACSSCIRLWAAQ